MNDMSAVIVAKSDQINADDLIAGPRVVTIASVKINPGTEQPVQMSLEGSDKVFRPCKTVSRIIVGLWGPDASKYVGKSLRLFRDPNVTWAGVKVGGIRVDQASHIDGEKTLVVKESQKASKLHKIKPLQQPSAGQDATVALTIDQAKADLDAAPDLDALRKVWSRQAMRPFRDDLAEHLAARKDDLTQVGRSDEQHGDQHDGTERITDALVEEFGR